MHILEIHNTKKYYNTHKAVDNVSFTVEKGKIFGLLGPNGSGKTTLLRMITGIFLPDEGKIIFGEKGLKNKMSPVDIGYMPEERGLYKKMKVKEQAIYLAQLKGVDYYIAKERIEKWFTQFDLTPWANKKVEDLSKGMSQKLQFLITIIHNPNIIILDEPFSGLDPINADKIKQEIYILAQQGKSIILCTHRMEQVEEMCDKIVLLNKGKKIYEGTIYNLKQANKENLFCVQLSQKLNRRKKYPFTILKEENNQLFVQLKKEQKSNVVLRALLDEKAEILSFQEVLPSLNQIFIQLVNTSSPNSNEKNFSYYTERVFN